MLLEGLRNVQVTAPEKVTLRCLIYLGRPTAEVQWYSNGKKIFTGDKYEITRDGETMSLVIAKSEETDSAIYRCEAINVFGEVQAECCVVVARTLNVVINVKGNSALIVYF